jgi:hypothetical protein
MRFWRTTRSSKASDIYVMAAIAYDLVTGWGRETNASVSGAGRSIPPRKLQPSLPEAAQALILPGLFEKEADRPQDAAAFGEELSRALKLTANTSRKRSRMNAVLVFLLLCVIAGVAYISRQVSPTNVPGRLRVWLRIEGQHSSVRRSSSALSQLSQDEGFRVEAEADAPGYLYLLTEPSNSTGPLTVFFPWSTTHGYSSYISPRTTVSIPERAPFGFKPGAGVDHLWIVWADANQDLLENAARRAKQPYQGVVREVKEAHAVRQALQNWQKPISPKIDALELSSVDGIMVGLIDISHR